MASVQDPNLFVYDVASAEVVESFNQKVGYGQGRGGTVEGFNLKTKCS